MTRLMPQQQSSGSGAVHMGHVSGSVHNSTQMQRDGAIQVGKVEGGMQVVHQHFYPAAPSPPESVKGSEEIAKAPTAAQREVLTLMKPLDRNQRIAVLEFMRREFRTAMVIELQPAQVYRVRRYVETINSRRREKA